MTDERLAETWVGENGFGSDCNNINSVDANREMVNAFLAGLKAGRPEWHDLRKDPNDLPKRNNELTDRSDVIITDKGIAHYNFRKQKWYVHNFECDMSFSEGVIAWCEIPTFTDSENGWGVSAWKEIVLPELKESE